MDKSRFPMNPLRSKPFCRARSQFFTHRSNVPEGNNRCPALNNILAPGGTFGPVGTLGTSVALVRLDRLVFRPATFCSSGESFLPGIGAGLPPGPIAFCAG